MVGILASRFDSRHSQKIIYISKVNQRRWLEESGQRLENVDQTHLVLTCVASQYYKKVFNFFLQNNSESCE